MHVCICWLCSCKDYLLSLKNESDKGRRDLAQGQILGFCHSRSKDFQVSVTFPMTSNNLLRSNSFIFCKHELILKNLFFNPQVEKCSSTLGNFNQVQKQTTFQSICDHWEQIESREPKHFYILSATSQPSPHPRLLAKSTNLCCHVLLPKCQSKKGEQR